MTPAINLSLVSLSPVNSLSPVSTTPAINENPWQGLMTPAINLSPVSLRPVNSLSPVRWPWSARGHDPATSCASLYQGHSLQHAEPWPPSGIITMTQLVALILHLETHHSSGSQLPEGSRPPGSIYNLLRKPWSGSLRRYFYRVMASNRVTTLWYEMPRRLLFFYLQFKYIAGHRHSGILYLSPVPVPVLLSRYRTGSGIGVSIHSGTGLIRCRKVQNSKL